MKRFVKENSTVLNQYWNMTGNDLLSVTKDCSIEFHNKVTKCSRIHNVYNVLLGNGKIQGLARRRLISLWHTVTTEEKAAMDF